MPRWRFAGTLCLGLCAALCAGRVAAQSSPCGDLAPGTDSDLDVTPQDRARGVARDAQVIARYADATALDGLLLTLADARGDDVCSREPICLFRGADRAAVAGELARVDDRTLAFVPDAPLAADTSYLALIARAGFDRVARTEIDFRTGDAIDREPPRFDAPRSELRLELDAPPAECDAAPGSRRVRLAVPAASDDGDPESVEILLFVTRAAGARGPSLRARAMNTDGGEVVLTFVLTPREVEAPVCVGLRAVDAAGHASEGTPELCFDPRQGSYFEPSCAAAAGPRPLHTGGGVLIPLLAYLLLLRVRRRRRAAHSVTPP